MKYLVQANPTNPDNRFIYTFQLVTRENWERNRLLKKHWNAIGNQNL